MSKLTYWQRVNLQAEIDAQNRGGRELKRIFRLYKKAFEGIEQDIAGIFGQLERQTELTAEEARELVRAAQRHDFQELKEAIEHTTDGEIKAALIRLTDAQAYGARIARLEAVRANLYLHLAKVAKREIQGLKGLFSDTMKDGYYNTIYHTAKVGNIGVDFALLPERAIEAAMNAPWHGKNFSDRVWNHVNETAGKAQQIVVTGLQRGISTDRMSQELQKALDVSYFNANRLIRTQTNHFLNLGTLRGYEETGTETYTYLATLDGKTCERCAPLDGKVFLVVEAVEGENYPTIHPFCRCTTTPGDRRPDKRIARDPETGKTYYVAGDTDFKTWYDTLPEEKREALEKYRLMDQRKSSDREQYKRYTEALGKENMPKTFDKFREMKYNDREKWDRLKEDYRKNHYFLQEQLTYEWNGEKNFIPSKALLKSVKTIAGGKSKTPVRTEEFLIKQLGGEPGEWLKRIGVVESEKYLFDVHWFELKGKQYKTKVKYRKDK